MFNLTGSEIMFLLIIGLVVLGPEKLPDAIRRIGRLYAELKRMSSGVQTDLRKVMDEPIKEMMKTTNSMKSLFNDTASQFQTTAKNIAVPDFVPYTASEAKEPRIQVVANEATEPETASLEPGDSDTQFNKIHDDKEIAEAIARAAQIADERLAKRKTEEAESINVLDDVS